MEILFENVKPADLTAFARELAARMDQADAFGPTLAQFLPNRNVDDFRSRVTKVSRTQTVARVRSFDARTPVGKRPVAVTQTQVALAPVGQKLPLREQEIILRALQDNNMGAVVDAVYDDTENNIGSIHNLVEQFRAQFLFTGRVAINDNGFIQEADYNLSADHNLDLSDVGTPWSTTSASVIEQELEWVQKTAQDASSPVTAAIASRRVVNALLKTQDYRNGVVDGQINYSLEAFNATRRAVGLPPVYIYDKAIGGERLTPDNKIVHVTQTVGETQWGITAEGSRYLPAGYFQEYQTEAPGIVATSWITDDPVNVWAKANATVLPVAGDINGLHVAEVLVESSES